MILIVDRNDSDGDDDDGDQSIFDLFDEGLEEDLADIMVLESMDLRNEIEQTDEWQNIQNVEHEIKLQEHKSAIKFGTKFQQSIKRPNLYR